MYCFSVTHQRYNECCVVLFLVFRLFLFSCSLALSCSLIFSSLGLLFSRLFFLDRGRVSEVKADILLFLSIPSVVAETNAGRSGGRCVWKSCSSFVAYADTHTQI